MCEKQIFPTVCEIICNFYILYINYVFSMYLITICEIFCFLIQIQQGSPVLCTFGSHWELVGLISESSMACEIPILVIKTAPYLPWMIWLVNMNEKLLDPIFSSLFSSYPGVEHDLSNDINHVNIFSDGLSLQSLSRLITSSQSRQRRNPLIVFFISNDRDSFPGTRQLYFQGDHLSTASKFPMAHSWTPIFKTLCTSIQDVF